MKILLDQNKPYESHGYIDGLQIVVHDNDVYIKIGESEVKVTKDVLASVIKYL